MQSLYHSRQRIGLVRISNGGLWVQAGEALFKARVIREQAGVTHHVQRRAVFIRKLGKIDTIDRQVASIVNSRSPRRGRNPIFLPQSLRSRSLRACTASITMLFTNRFGTLSMHGLARHVVKHLSKFASALRP